MSGEPGTPFQFDLYPDTPTLRSALRSDSSGPVFFDTFPLMALATASEEAGGELRRRIAIVLRLVFIF